MSAHIDRISWLRSYRKWRYGAAGACAYLASFAVPAQSILNIAFIGLTLLSAVASIARLQSSGIGRSPLILPVLLFAGATSLSILGSVDVSRSLQLSAGLLPALLLFFLISEHFVDVADMRLLFFVLSSVALALAIMLLGIAMTHRGMGPRDWITTLGSPILIVPNDVTFLAVLAPLSLALLYCKPYCAAAVLTVVSLILSVFVACVYQSRGALITLVAGMVCASALIRPRLSLICGFSALALALLVDALLGFPLVTKFATQLENHSRFPLWLAAFAMFRDAPLLGQGPHTFVSFYRPYLHALDLPAWLTHSSADTIPWAHNLYLEMLGEQGIVGLFALGFLLFRGTSIAYSLQSKASGESRILAAGICASLFAFCVAAGFELTLLRLWVVVIMFVFLGVSSHFASSLMRKEVE
jgi:putative inorganic carbon (hco3(-)) transporter